MSTRQQTSSNSSQHRLALAVIFVMFGPLLLYGFFERNVYFPSGALILGAIVAVLLTPVLVKYLLRRRARLEAAGKIAALTVEQRMGIPIVAFLVIYEWSLTALACSPLLFQLNQTEHTYIVYSAEQCTWKCSKCDYNVWVANWPGARTSPLCADGVQPRPSVNQKLLVRGYFTNYAIYVSALSSGR